MTTHIDTMQEWWELAGVGIPQAGDTVIFDERHRGLGFHVTQATTDHPGGYDNARILARAPKPAWHDAVAVIATYDDHVDQETFRGVWTPDGDGIWQHEDGVVAGADALTDVTPLIEAKVTDEMVHRAAAVFARARDDGHVKPFAAALTAALGLETE